MERSDTLVLTGQCHFTADGINLRDGIDLWEQKNSGDTITE